MSKSAESWSQLEAAERIKSYRKTCNMAADIAGDNLYCLQRLYADRVVRSRFPDIAQETNSEDKNCLENCLEIQF